MRKAKALRVAGFVGALCASAALVGTSVAGTGAYFSDSHPGQISASSGHLNLNLPAGTDMNLAYSALMPGQNVDKQIKYTTDVSSGGVDIWLVFDKNDAGYQAFTGAKHSALWDDGGLGRYGYFKVSDSNGGLAFRTGNLQFENPSNTPGTANACTTNADGRGGSDWIATAADHNPTQFCGVPSQILLASNLGTNRTGTVTVTFGLNGYMQTQQNQPEPTVGYKLVATQHGITPSDPSYPN